MYLLLILNSISNKYYCAIDRKGNWIWNTTFPSKNVEGAAKTFGKIKQENMPEIDRLLGNMVVTNVEFCSVLGKIQKIFIL